jgi:hypothetical protein
MRIYDSHSGGCEKFYHQSYNTLHSGDRLN